MISSASANPVLNGHANKFLRDRAGFAGLRLFPVFATGLQSADYYVFDRENLLLVPDNARHAPGSPYRRIRMKVSDDNYSCKDYGLEAPVADSERSKYASFLAADQAAVDMLVDMILIGHERRVRDIATNTANVPNASPGTKWDQANSDPFADCDAAKEAIRKATGLKANTMLINADVKNVLKEHPKVLEKIKYTGQGGIIPESALASVLAQAFGVREVIIAESVEATNQEGQALTPADIWLDTVIFAHVRSEQNLMAPNFGRTFMWTAFGGRDTIQVETYRDEPVKSDVHRALHHVDEKLVGGEAGYLLTNVLAA
jgi:hypothetical protein